MALKTVLAACLATFILAGPASADHRLHLGLGPVLQSDDCDWIGQVYHCFGPHFGNPHVVEPHHTAFNRMSCSEARLRVQQRGFRKVKTERCHGKTLTFIAVKNGKNYRVKVNAFTGRLKPYAL